VTGTQQILTAGKPMTAGGRQRPSWFGQYRRSDLAWATAFVVPYAAVLLVFAVYPIVYGLWLGAEPSLYTDLASDPLYLQTVVNTLLFVAIGTNLTMFAALLLSGYFMRRGWWSKAVLVVFILPWALPAIPAFISFHWMLIGEQGLIDSLLSTLFGTQGPIWFNHRGLALGSNIVSYFWKWLPFWTLIFLAGRMAIPPDIYEAADIDGATGTRRFIHVTFPLLASLYLICTLLCAIWMIGDFTTVSLVSGGAPALSTEVLATLSIHYAFDSGRPDLGVAAAMSAVPLLIPLVILLMRKVQTMEVQL
jgi:multiple sugar transport system permease protein